MFRKTKELLTNLKKENRILRHNNEILVRKDCALLHAFSEFKGVTQTNQYNSTDNVLNQMRKILAELEAKLESLN